MGGQVSIRCGCCSGKTEGNDNFDEEVEDKLTVAEKISNSYPLDDDSQSQIRMPVLHRSFSERTLPVN